MLLFYEYIQIALQRKYYFRNWENLLQMFVFIGVITFVSNYQSSKCGCESSEIWQLGALVVASAWFNLLVLLRSVPTIGAPINLFILIVQNYARLVYLPILLVATFGIPFHMLFVRDDDGSVSGLENHYHALSSCVCVHMYHPSEYRTKLVY